MKVLKHLVLSVLALVAIILSSCSDRPVVPAQVPAVIQAFVKQNFPNQTISYAERDLEWFWYKYDVVLADGTEINFDTDNEWDKIDCHMTAVPAALVPAPIATYCKTNCPGVVITKVDKEFGGYDVELANDMELRFNKQGALMSMDD